VVTISGAVRFQFSAESKSLEAAFTRQPKLKLFLSGTLIIGT